MTTEKIGEALKSSSLAEGLSEEEQDILADISELKSLDDGDHLTKEGDEAEHLYVVISGILAVMKWMPSGEQEILCRLTKNELAGISGFVEGQKRLADLLSSGKTEVLTISRDKFKSLTKTHPEIVYKVMCVLVREGLDIVRRLNENMVELNDYAELVQARY